MYDVFVPSITLSKIISRYILNRANKDGYYCMRITSVPSRNTGVAIDTVNLVWTFGFFGFLVGSLISGFVFKRYINSARGKLLFLFSTISLTGVRYCIDFMMYVYIIYVYIIYIQGVFLP